MWGDAGIFQRLLLGGKWIIGRVRAVRVDPDFFRRLVPPLLVLVACVVLLEVYVRVAEVKAYMMVPPSEIARTMVKDREDLIKALKWTTVSAVGGFAVSAIAGVVMAVILSHLIAAAAEAFYPYTIFFQTVPIVAIAPLLLLWFHSGLLPVVACAFVVSVFPVIANTMAGLLSTDPALVDLFQKALTARQENQCDVEASAAVGIAEYFRRVADRRRAGGHRDHRRGIPGGTNCGESRAGRDDRRCQGAGPARPCFCGGAAGINARVGDACDGQCRRAACSLRNWHASERDESSCKTCEKAVPMLRRMLKMEFPLGKPILVMIILSAVAPARWLSVQRDPPRKDLTLWVFAKPQFDEYDKARPTFEAQSGKSVEIDLISSMAMDTRLAALFMAHSGNRTNCLTRLKSRSSSIGRYLRPAG